MDRGVCAWTIDAEISFFFFTPFETRDKYIPFLQHK